MSKLLFDFSASGQPVVTGWVKAPAYDRGFYNASRTEAVKELVQKIAVEHTKNVPLIWNIEHWPMPAQQDKIIQVIEWAREARPDLRQSIYSVAPIRNYWAPVELYLIPTNPHYQRRFAQWQALNEQMGKLAEVLDFICPSIYTFYQNTDGHGRHNEFWFEYAKANIEEAKKYKKQVIPFVSPRLWAVPGHPPMDIMFFKQQVEFAIEHSDGVFVFDWSGNNPQIDLSEMMRAIAESDAV